MSDLESQQRRGGRPHHYRRTPHHSHREEAHSPHHYTWSASYTPNPDGETRARLLQSPQVETLLQQTRWAWVDYASVQGPLNAELYQRAFMRTGSAMYALSVRSVISACLPPCPLCEVTPRGTGNLLGLNFELRTSLSRRPKATRWRTCSWILIVVGHEVLRALVTGKCLYECSLVRTNCGFVRSAAGGAEGQLHSTDTLQPHRCSGSMFLPHLTFSDQWTTHPGRDLQRSHESHLKTEVAGSETSIEAT
uniref:Uncharacterized protein n=1 Tax=Knipowitschia caucasica TaxID=637954 RepID=A0AAV2M2R1_KNICA